MSELERRRPSSETEDDAPALPEDDLEHYDRRVGGAARRQGRRARRRSRGAAGEPGVLPTDDVFPVGEPPSGFYTVSA